LMKTDKINDSELMSRLASGRMDALAEIVNRHQDRVIALAYRFLNDWAKAEDVAQETFLRIYKASYNYSPRARFTTWVYRIVVNLCLDEQRKQAKMPISIEEAACALTVDWQSDHIEKKEIIELVKKAIDELPDRQRLAVILHRYENLSYEQICEVTDWTKPAVESLLVRAYANLRKKLGKIENFME
jgi:RNA polymerase sigma-70 factor (ECF subfamily)